MPYLVYLILWFTVAIPALVGLALYKRLEVPARLITILMCLGLFTEVWLRFVAHQNSNNLYIINFYTCLETLLLAFFLAKIVSSPSAKRIIKITGCIVLALILTEMVVGGFNTWVSFSSTLESVYIIVVGLYFFYEVATALTPGSPFQSSGFWLTAIVMFYFMSSLEYFLLNRYLVDVSRRDLMMLGNIHTFVNAFCNLAYALVIWKFTRLHSLAR